MIATVCWIFLFAIIVRCPPNTTSSAASMVRQIVLTPEGLVGIHVGFLTIAGMELRDVNCKQATSLTAAQKSSSSMSTTNQTAGRTCWSPTTRTQQAVPQYAATAKFKDVAVEGRPRRSDTEGKARAGIWASTPEISMAQANPVYLLPTSTMNDGYYRDNHIGSGGGAGRRGVGVRRRVNPSASGRHRKKYHSALAVCP